MDECARKLKLILRMTADFVIVGGGIGGLVLAELLGRGGKKVVVLEKSTAAPTWTRPEILWPATVELLRSLAPKEVWEHAMLPLRALEFFNGERFVSPIDEKLFAEARVQPWSTDPNLTREVLFGLQAFELRRGVEVAEVLKDNERVIGVRARNLRTKETFEVLGQWTVGDDGANSVVRAASGIGLKSRMFPIEFLCFKCDWPADFPERVARIWPNVKHPETGIVALGAIAIPNGKGAALVPVRPREFDALGNPASAWSEFCRIDAGIGKVAGNRKFPDDFARVRRPWGHAARYSAPGALIMGDAAHPVSPAGGQGANMSIADGQAIAELALAKHPDLGNEYERRRRPANERSLGVTRRAAWLQELPAWSRPLPLFFALAGWIGRHPALLRRAVRFASTAFKSANGQ